MAVVGAVLAGVSSLGGLFSNSKDPGRLAANANAYSAALGGDAGALLFLKARSGLYGLVNGVPAPWNGSPGQPLGGWATDKAKQDAANKFNSASASIAGVPLAGTAATTPKSFGDKIADAISGFGNTIGTAAGQAATGGETGAAVQKVASTTNTVLIFALIAAVGLGGFYIYKHAK